MILSFEILVILRLLLANGVFALAKISTVFAHHAHARGTPFKALRIRTPQGGSSGFCAQMSAAMGTARSARFLPPAHDSAPEAGAA